MLHLIQDMGREIVRSESPNEPGERSRLWCSEESFDVLIEKTGTRRIIGLSLMCMHPATKDGIEIDALESMGNLMLLRLNNAILIGSYKKLPRRLRWLCWHGFPWTSIPLDIFLEKLAVLDLSYSNLVTVWDGYKKLAALKILNLNFSKSLIRTPDLRGLLNLECLVLKGCVSLVEICPFIGNLKKLRLLNLKNCRSLQRIPSLPVSLETVLLAGSNSISSLKETFANRAENSLSKEIITKTPVTFQLVKLNVAGCNLNDDSFPIDFSYLPWLESLNLSKNLITKLPGCIKSLERLRVLTVKSCKQLQLVLNVPSSVKCLDINKNLVLKKVMGVPQSMTEFWCHFYSNLAEVEGCFKVVPIENVDRNLQKLMGLELMTRPIEVFYEYGVFSSNAQGTKVPRCCRFIQQGPTISFVVPSLPNDAKMEGFNIFFAYTISCQQKPKPYNVFCEYRLKIFNKSKGVSWTYIPKARTCNLVRPVGDYVWSGLWKCGKFLESGNQVVVTVYLDEPVRPIPINVKECGIKLVFEREIMQHDATNEREVTPALYWEDKLLVDVSHYCNGLPPSFKVISGKSNMRMRRVKNVGILSRVKIGLKRKRSEVMYGFGVMDSDLTELLSADIIFRAVDWWGRSKPYGSRLLLGDGSGCGPRVPNIDLESPPSELDFEEVDSLDSSQSSESGPESGDSWGPSVKEYLSGPWLPESHFKLD